MIAEGTAGKTSILDELDNDSEVERLNQLEDHSSLSKCQKSKELNSSKQRVQEDQLCYERVAEKVSEEKQRPQNPLGEHTPDMSCILARDADQSISNSYISTQLVGKKKS